MFCATSNWDRRGARRGFSVVKGLVSAAGAAQLRSEIRSLERTASTDWLQRNSARTRSGDALVIRSIDTPSDLLFRLGRAPELISVAEEFAAKRVTPLYSEYFNKPPGSQCKTPSHQDQAFYSEHFSDELGLTFWIALDDCTRRNGCMHVRPQRSNVIYPHKPSRTVGFRYEMVDQSTRGFVEIPLEAGDALLFGSYTPHYCPPNRTSLNRRAIAISFRTSDYREQQWPTRS